MEQSKWEAILSKMARWYKGDGPGPKKNNPTGTITVIEWFDRPSICKDCEQGVVNRVTTLAWRNGAWHERCKACKLTRVVPEPFGTGGKEKELEDLDRSDPEPEVKPKQSRGRPRKLSPRPMLPSQPNAISQTFETDHVIIHLYDHVSLASDSQDDPDDPQNDQNA
jgi:hypothetical protein